MIRVGLIGYGLSGRVFHAPYISATRGMALVAIATSQAEAAGRDHPGVAVRSPEEVIGDANVDLVVVATPNAAHTPLAQGALHAGKAVVVDKPLAVSLEEGRRLVDEARDLGAKLFPFHNRRWDDDFLTLTAVLAEGAIGDLVTLESRFDRFRPEVPDRWRERPGPAAGLWWDLGPHLIDQTLCLLGPPEAVTADMAVQRIGATVTDYLHVVLHYGTRRAILRAGCLAAGGAPRLCAQGTAGAFTTWGFDPQEDRLRNPASGPEAPRTGELAQAGPDGPVAPPGSARPGPLWRLLSRCPQRPRRRRRGPGDASGRPDRPRHPGGGGDQRGAGTNDPTRRPDRLSADACRRRLRPDKFARNRPPIADRAARSPSSQASPSPTETWRTR